MNIILIVVDSLWAEHLSCYDYSRETSPNLDQLAKDGTLFRNCFTEFPYTYSAFTSIITGRFGVNTGVVVNTWTDINQNNIVLDDSIPTMAEMLRAVDFTTVAVDNMMNFASHPKWFVRGHQFYINPKATPYHREIDLFQSKYRQDIVDTTDKVTADEVNERILPWLKTYHKDKFFLFVHYWDPHGFSGGPYEPKEFKDKFSGEEGLEHYNTSSEELYIKACGSASHLTQERMERFNLYDCTIAYLDDRLGRVFDQLKDFGLYDDSLIIVTADHGTWEIPLGRKGFPHLSDARLHIPLIIKAPKDENSDMTIDAFVQPVDILPTILNLLDYGSSFTCRDVEWAYSREFRPPEGVDGISLLPLIRGEKTEHRDEVYGTVVSGHCARCIMTTEWKLIKHFIGGRKPFLKDDYELPPDELYHLTEDPEQLINVAEKNPEIIKELDAKLQAWIDENVKKSGKTDPILIPKMVGGGNNPVWT